MFYDESCPTLDSPVGAEPWTRNDPAPRTRDNWGRARGQLHRAESKSAGGAKPRPKPVPARPEVRSPCEAPLRTSGLFRRPPKASNISKAWTSDRTQSAFGVVGPLPNGGQI